MKRPDEIKKGLECRIRSYKDICNHQCDTCDLRIPAYSIFERYEDALVLIQQLEATVSEKEKVVAELSGKIGQLEAERDAAVNDLHYLVNHPLSAGPCYACLHSKDCWRGGDCDPVNDDRWQWRGICKEGH